MFTPAASAANLGHSSSVRRLLFGELVGVSSLRRETEGFDEGERGGDTGREYVRMPAGLSCGVSAVLAQRRSAGTILGREVLKDDRLVWYAL